MSIHVLTRFVLILAAATSLGCKSPASAEKGPLDKGMVETKKQAPVQIEADIRAGEATVTLRFPSEAENVRVILSGASGLGLEGGKLQEGLGSLRADSERELSVSFDPEQSTGLLNVVVEGDFGGRLLGKAQAFEVGTPEAIEDEHRYIDGKKVKDHRVGP